jgi:hypothetical protein
MRRLMMVLAAIAAAAIGCSGDEGGVPSVMSCEYTELPNTHWCYEFTGSGLSAEQVAALESNCMKVLGTNSSVRWATEACPGTTSAGVRSGTCTVNATDSVPYWHNGGLPGKVVKIMYYDPPVDSVEGAVICGHDNGTWTQ